MISKCNYMWTLSDRNLYSDNLRFLAPVEFEIIDSFELSEE